MTIDAESVIQGLMPDTKWYLVMKPFQGESGLLQSGEVVDTSNWKHIKSLANSRYIMAVPAGVEIPEAKKGADGVSRRIMSSEEISERPTPSRKKA